MRSFKRHLWRPTIAIAGLLFFMVLTVWIPFSVYAFDETSGHAIAHSVKAAPTMDITATVLAKEKLQLDVDQEQHTLGNWLWGNGVALLSILAVVAGGLFGFFRWQSDRREAVRSTARDYQKNLEITLDNRRETILQTYIDNISEMLLKEQLYSSDKVSSVRIIARVRTITVLTQLDARRVGYVFTFLREAGLVSTTADDNVVSLRDADFREVDWSLAYLDEVILSNTNLTYANLTRASLRGAYLKGSDIRTAQLRGADLRNAHLEEADLTYASLSGANLSGADLSKANLTLTDLSGANLKDASLLGVKGLPKDQLKAFATVGAITDEDASMSPPQPASASTAPSRGSAGQTPPAPSTQVNTPAPSKDEGSTAAAKQSSDLQTPAATPAQVSTPPANPDGSKAAPSQPSAEP